MGTFLPILVASIFTVVFMLLIIRSGRKNTYECAFHAPSCRRLAICQNLKVESYRDDTGTNEVVRVNRLWKLLDTRTGRLVQRRPLKTTEEPVWQMGRLVFVYRTDSPELSAIDLASLDFSLSRELEDVAHPPDLAIDPTDGALAFRDRKGGMRKIDPVDLISIPASDASLTPLTVGLPHADTWSLAPLPGSPYENQSGELVLQEGMERPLGRFYDGGLIAATPRIPWDTRPRHAVADGSVFVVHKKDPSADTTQLVSKIRIDSARTEWTHAATGTIKAAFLDADLVIVVHTLGKNRSYVTALAIDDGAVRWSTKV